MARFDPAPSRVNTIIRDTIDEWYPDLVEAKIKVAAVFAYETINDEGKSSGPAMKKAGNQILYKLKKHSEEDRAGGSADVTIVIDAKEWERLEEEEPDAAECLEAFLGEPLGGIEILRDQGVVRVNDQGRPMVKIRPFDWTVSGYRSAVEKFGRRSPSKRAARQFHDTYGNLLFDFASDRADQPTLPGVEAEKKNRKPRKSAVVAAVNR